MKAFFIKPYRFAAVYSVVLTLFTAYVLLDTFVIPRPVTPAAVNYMVSSVSLSDSSCADSETLSASPSPAPVITYNSYKDANIRITIDSFRKYETDIYVADIRLSSLSYLKAAFAYNTYGRNIRQKPSMIAEDHHAIFAINGDYYGFRDTGFVLRNGTLYRTAARTSGITDDLVIDKSGNFSILDESRTAAGSLSGLDAWQIFSFGPALLNGGKIAVTASSEVEQSSVSDPRTAIGEVSPLHYIVIVSDGRASDNAGLTLLELAKEFQLRGCGVAYNLDGGGSSTMWFHGQIVNTPTDGKNMGERSVSDIVTIGY